MYFTEKRLCWEANSCSSGPNNVLPCVETEVLLPSSQEASTGSCSEPCESSSHLYFPF